jgi:hypothetical protein
VIDVSVREQQKFQIELARFEPVASAIGRVEQNPAFRRLNQTAVGLENTAAEGFVSHWVKISFVGAASYEGRKDSTDGHKALRQFGGLLQ